MRKIIRNIIIFIFVVFSLQINAQMSETKRHEVKLNLFWLVFPTALTTAEVDYEYLLNKWSSVGITVSYTLGTKVQEVQGQVFGTYRVYFLNKQPASGLFVEGIFGVTFREEYKAISGYFPHGNGGWVKSESYTYTVATVGASAGYKYYFPKPSVSLELFFGGLLMINDKVDRGIYPRLGLSVGKRF
jgi:hypothetical protein